MNEERVRKLEGSFAKPPDNQNGCPPAVISESEHGVGCSHTGDKNQNTSDQNQNTGDQMPGPLLGHLCRSATCPDISAVKVRHNHCQPLSVILEVLLWF